MTDLPLFAHALDRLRRAARSRPAANNRAAMKRLRAFVRDLLRCEVSAR